MRSALLRSALFMFVLAGPLVSLAAAQGGSAKSTLSGTVVDIGGGVLPGATVVIRNAATSVETATMTNETGAFDVPALDASSPKDRSSRAST
jgi:Carboxypeptidase regulatory-like domain